MKMKFEFLSEPELQFGHGCHIDVRFGLMNLGPVDLNQVTAPKKIGLGIIGTNESIEGIQDWFNKCRNELHEKESRQTNLFVKFPGFNQETGFHSELCFSDENNRVISKKAFEDVEKISNFENRVKVAVDLFYSEITSLLEDRSVQVLICVPPVSLTGLLFNETEETGKQFKKADFHHMLKAKCLKFNIPIQIILPSTYDETQRRKIKKKPLLLRRNQDEATRAWNLHTALYYKAKGTPWRLCRNPQEFSSCFIGVSFYKSLEQGHLETSVAQVFNERGEGVVIKGGMAQIAKEDLEPHLNEEDSYTLLKRALELYKREHKNFPARIVVHKSSIHSKEEVSGFRKAINELGVELLELISFGRSDIRFFRRGAYPPLRGTFASFGSERNILYTHGSVDFYATYPGMFIPEPLLFRCDSTEQTPFFLASEILALTKMNWNNTQYIREPITLYGARQVGKILKYLTANDTIVPHYRFYM